MEKKPFTVLVPLDGSALALQAIPYAQALAAEDGQVVLATVLDPPEPHKDDRGWRFPVTDQDEERMVDRAREYLLGEAGTWLPDKKAVHVETRTGDHAEEILRIASDLGVDMIAIASHGRGALGRLRFGSVADRVSREAEMPVLVIRAADAEVEMMKGKVRKLIVALDGSERSERSLLVVSDIARRTGDLVHLVSVIDAPAAMIVPVPWMMPALARSKSEESLPEMRQRQSDRLSRQAQSLIDQGIQTTWSVETGDPFDEIDKLAEYHDIIVITSHGRSGLERWAWGSLAEKLVRHAHAPVMIIKSRAVEASSGLPAEREIHGDGSDASKKAAVTASLWTSING